MPDYPTLTPQQFVAKWKQVALSERATYQQHFLDLCALIGHRTPIEDDPRGTRFTFEAGVTKQSGQRGWADVWKKGCFALEYKGKHADLDKAYTQILQYREALQNPPLLVVSDTSELRIHTNFTNTVKQVVTITLDDLLTPMGLQRLRDMFTNVDAFRTEQTTEQVTEDAAAQFAELSRLLQRYGETPQATAHFLIRLLFCLFAERVDLLPNKVFTTLITKFRPRPIEFHQQLRHLFDTMATGGLFWSEDILFFNGNLFDNAEILELDSDSLTILESVSEFDWGSIEPSIFGTLFERSLDPAKRAQQGAHYTSKDDILLIVEPVLMAPLRKRWGQVQHDVRALAIQRDDLTPSKQAAVTKTITQRLQAFAQDIAAVRVLDPACGSGNFLYVALKLLLDLEKEVIVLAGDLGAGQFFSSVSPEQLRGIELNTYAHELAQVTVWIGYIQWLRDNGYGRPSEPILKPLDTIVQMDAILAVDSATGRPIEPAWPDADVIIGNPPFLGGKSIRNEIGLLYSSNLYTLYDSRLPRRSDLVCYWFERARSLIEQQRVQRVGFLATQAIRNGDNRVVLDRIKATGNIFMAWSNRPWVLDGAAVRVSMVGFDDGSEQVRTLDGQIVDELTSDLAKTFGVSRTKSLVENKGISFQGIIQRGNFHVPPDVAQKMLAYKGNPHGRPNSDVIKPLLNGSDVTRRPRKIFVIDFGVKMSEEHAAMYEDPFGWVKEHVYPMRQQANQPSAREKWWLHWNARPALRGALAQIQRYIVTPAVAKHRLFIWVDADVLPDHRLCAIAREDDYFFGVLHSRLHEVWSLATSSRHGDGDEGGRPTYNNTTCFETFPFPWAPGTEPVDDARVQAIAAAAKRLVELRENWLNPPGTDEAELKKRTLTNLYNARPTWLAMAHAALDAAVCAAYGWPTDMSDEQILERLLALNLERAG